MVIIKQNAKKVKLFIDGIEQDNNFQCNFDIKYYTNTNNNIIYFNGNDLKYIINSWL